jgi:hypothetical protein
MMTSAWARPDAGASICGAALVSGDLADEPDGGSVADVTVAGAVFAQAPRRHAPSRAGIVLVDAAMLREAASDVPRAVEELHGS